MSASYEVRGSVAVITLNNPPVNGLGYATRVGIADGPGPRGGRPGVKAVVLTGGGRPSRAVPTSRSSVRPRPAPSPTCCR
jgi:3-hydroxyacyl-CoA dehydrogenase